MTIEDKLKSLILTRYRSIREFAAVADIPYTTFDSILRRGINNSNVINIIKVCRVLNISAEALADGSIEPKTEPNKTQSDDLRDIVNDTKARLFNATTLTIAGRKVDIEYADAFVDALDLGFKMVERKTIRQTEEVDS